MSYSIGQLQFSIHIKQWNTMNILTSSFLAMLLLSFLAMILLSFLAMLLLSFLDMLLLLQFLALHKADLVNLRIFYFSKWLGRSSDQSYSIQLRK